MDLSALIEQFKQLGDKIKDAGGALSGGAGGTSLSSAITDLNGTSLQPIIGEFDSLKSAIDNAIGSLGSEGAGFAAALENLREVASTSIGAAVGEESDSVIGAFTKLEAQTQEVALLGIGTEDAAADDGTLNGAITSLHEMTDTHVGVELKNQIQDVAKTGVGTTTTTPDDETLTGALNGLHKVTDKEVGKKKGEKEKSVIGDFEQLKDEVQDVAKTGVGTTTTTADDKTMTGAMDGLHKVADKEIGDTANTDGDTVIGDFVQLGKTIQSVVNDDIGKQTDTSENSTINGAISGFDDGTKAHVEGNITPRFEKLRDVIGEAEQNVLDTKSAVESLDGMTSHVTIEIEYVTKGNPGEYYTGTVFPSKTDSFNAQYATGTANPHYEGIAKLSGDWRVPKPGKSLVGELGQELV